MQNGYVGDIGDFGKYGLLRYLTGMHGEPLDPPGLRLGVAWYVNHQDPPGAAGNHIGYLSPVSDHAQRFRGCDPVLWHSLRLLVFNDRRRIAAVQASGILPDDTRYHAGKFRYCRNSRICPARVERRQRWFQDVIIGTEEAEIVFVDPDVGISDDDDVDKLYRINWPSYVSMAELQQFWQRDQSLVIYQSERSNSLPDLRANLVQALQLPAPPIALRFRTLSPRWFIVIPQPQHRALIRQRINLLLANPWALNGHFEEV